MRTSRTWDRKVGLLALALLLAACSGGGKRAEVPSSQAPVDRRMVPVEGLEGVCFLALNRKLGAVLDQDMTATGVLLDGRFVLTAGHNLVNAPYPWGRIESIGIQVGRAEAGGRKPQAIVKGGAVEKDRIPPGGIWTVAPAFHWRPTTWRDPFLGSTTMIQHDYGFIDAGRRIGSDSFRLGLPPGETLRVGEVIEVAGYPGDPGRIDGATGTRLFRGRGRVTAVTGNLFSTNIITARGLSGAPVWVERNGRNYLVGIHVGSDFAGQKGAVARRVDEALVRDWNRWTSRRWQGR